MILQILGVFSIIGSSVTLENKIGERVFPDPELKSTPINFVDFQFTSRHHKPLQKEFGETNFLENFKPQKNTQNVITRYKRYTNSGQILFPDKVNLDQNLNGRVQKKFRTSHFYRKKRNEQIVFPDDDDDERFENPNLLQDRYSNFGRPNRPRILPPPNRRQLGFPGQTNRNPIRRPVTFPSFPNMFGEQFSMAPPANNFGGQFSRPPPANNFGGQFSRPSTTTRAPPTTTTEVAVPGMGTTRTPCEDACLTTPEYNPVCGDNNITYFSMARLNCARRCGRPVGILHMGRCALLG